MRILNRSEQSASRKFCSRILSKKGHHNIEPKMDTLRQMYFAEHVLFKDTLIPHGIKIKRGKIRTRHHSFCWV